MGKQEEQLAALLADDLDTYFEQLVLAYQDRLYAFMLLRVSSPQTAEELVLVALERAYFALKGYPPQRIRILRLEPWLFEITRNAFYNHIRDTRVRNSYLPSISLDLSEDSPLLAIEDRAIEPDEAVCRQEERHELEACVALLPQQYQEALHLYYFSNLTYREIAEQLHQPEGTVKTHIHRGTKLMRSVLQTQSKEAR